MVRVRVRVTIGSIMDLGELRGAAAAEQLQQQQRSCCSFAGDTH